MSQWELARMVLYSYDDYITVAVLPWNDDRAIIEYRPAKPSVLVYILTNQVVSPIYNTRIRQQSTAARHMATTQYVWTGQVINYDVHKLTEDSGQQWSVSWD